MTEATEDWRPASMPVMQIATAARLLSRLADMRLREIGISTSQIPVLFALKDGAQLTQKQLAGLAGIEQPSMAQLLARMERDGLIRRDADPADRRSSLVSLSDVARERITPGRAILARGNTDALAGLDEADVATLISLLDRVIANLTEQG